MVSVVVPARDLSQRNLKVFPSKAWSTVYGVPVESSGLHGDSRG